MIQQSANHYPGVLIAGSRPRTMSFFRRRRGLGNGSSCMSGGDFYAALGPQTNCDPRDSSCVLCNQQRSDAISNLVDSGCVQPGTPISFSCDTSPAALTAFQNNSPLAVNATVGTGSSSFVASGPTLTMQPTAFTGRFNTLTPTGAPSSMPTQQQNVAWSALPPMQPMAPGPAAPEVVNPSPNTLMTTTGSSFISPTSVLSQANGTTMLTSTSGGVSTVGGWFTDPSRDLIATLPNWALLALAGAGLFVVVTLAMRR